MSRRDRGRQGDLFGNSEPEDEALPELEDLLRAHAPRRGRRPNSAARIASAYLFRPRRARVRGRRWVLWVRVGICSLLLVFSVIGFGAGLTNAVSGYSDAGTFAGAPTCAAGVDPTSTTTNCVGTLNLVSAEYGVYDDGNGDAIDLDLPPADSQNAVTATFPGNADFENAVGYGPSVVRAEFWRGQIVALTAGAQGVTVTTDQNPNNVGGNGLGVALISLTVALLSALLFIGIRGFRERWLGPGPVLRLSVSGLSIWSLGLFIAGCCLTAQPAWVLRIGVIVPSVAVGLTALLWFALIPGRAGRVRRGYRLR
jgi:hypothetical protein